MDITTKLSYQDAFTMFEWKANVRNEYIDLEKKNKFLLYKIFSMNPKNIPWNDCIAQLLNLKLLKKKNYLFKISMYLLRQNRDLSWMIIE